MNLKAQICYLFSLVGIRSLDCDRCETRATCWIRMLERLRELNRQTESDSRRKWDWPNAR
jgi:hypothetical protein